MIICGFIIFLMVILFYQWNIKGSQQMTSLNQMEAKPSTSYQSYEGKLYLNPLNGQIKVGESINIAIMLHAPGKSLDGADIILDYDPALFDVLTTGGKLTTGDAFPSYPKNRVDSTKGKIYLTGITLEPKPEAVTPDRIMAELVLKAKKEGAGRLSFEWVKGNKSLSTIIENGTSKTLLGDVGDGNYQIVK